MADPKRILIIDDNFEIALFLRTTLEIIWPDYQVANVPSAEEGMLEIRRGVSLLITDLKLPGMQGTEFIRWARRSVPETPVIVITGEHDTRLHEEARSLGLAGFFLKPLEVDELTAAVRRVLGGAGLAPQARPDLPPLPAQVLSRLSSLRIDTGASYVMLVDGRGRCLLHDGQIEGLDLHQVAALLANELTTAFELARVLKAPQPFTINYQAGALHDLYAANVGPGYLLALIFDAQRGRGQIGAVWIYARRAVRELLDLLSTAPAPQPAAAAPPSQQAAPRPAAAEPTRREKPAPPTPAVAPPPVTTTPAVVPAASSAQAAAPTQVARPSNPVATPIQTPDPPPTIAEPAAAPPDPEPADERPAPPSEVDAFWDSVLDEGAGEGTGFGGISLEEARARGLIPSDFGLH